MAAHAETGRHPPRHRRHQPVRAAVAGVGIEPSGTPGRGPFEQLDVVALEAVQARQQHAGGLAGGGFGDHQVEPVERRDVGADIDPAGKGVKIFGGKSGRHPGIAKRPVKPLADFALDSDRCVG